MSSAANSESLRLGIRERTEDDQPDRPRHVVCFPDRGTDLAVFGQVEGGETREEAVFWAERAASKNGFDFQRPEGWQNVVGRLP
jgi:hypothetical protein